jgi:hypothetical protein
MLIIHFFVFRGFDSRSALEPPLKSTTKSDRALMKKSVSLRWNLTMKNCHSFGKHDNISIFLNAVSFDASLMTFCQLNRFYNVELKKKKRRRRRSDYK